MKAMRSPKPPRMTVRIRGMLIRSLAITINRPAIHATGVWSTTGPRVNKTTSINKPENTPAMRLRAPMRSDSADRAKLPLVG